MSIFSPKNLTPEDVVDRIVRDGIAACKENLSQFADASDVQRHDMRRHNERVLTLLAMDRLTWELALSRADGPSIETIRMAVRKHYGDVLAKQLGERLKAPRTIKGDAKKRLAHALARRVGGRTARLAKEWIAHKYDRPGPEYWACKSAVRLMGLDESNPHHVARLSEKVRPSLVSNMRYIKEVAPRVKAG